MCFLTNNGYGFCRQSHKIVYFLSQMSYHFRRGRKYEKLCVIRYSFEFVANNGCFTSCLATCESKAFVVGASSGNNK